MKMVKIVGGGEIDECGQHLQGDKVLFDLFTCWVICVLLYRDCRVTGHFTGLKHPCYSIDSINDRSLEDEDCHCIALSVPVSPEAQLLTAGVFFFVSSNFLASSSHQIINPREIILGISISETSSSVVIGLPRSPSGAAPLL